MRISDWSSDVCSSDLCRGIGARTRLGEAIARHLVHRDEAGQELRLDRVAAETVDHPARHIVDRDEGAGRGAAIGHRLHDQRGFEPAEADAARFLADIDSGEAQLGGRLDHIAREYLLFIPFGGVRRDRIGGELARHLLNGALVVGQLELVGHFPVSIMASASISTFHSGRSRPATTAIVAAGRTSPNTAPCARPTRSASAGSVMNMRVRTTSAGEPPSAASASAMIVRQRAACTRSEEHTSELQSLMSNSYAVFCLKKKKTTNQ